MRADDATREQDAQLARLSERVLAMLRSRVDSASQAVHAARGHLAADGPRTLGAWKTFTDSEMAAVDRGVVGLGYIERVRRDQIPALEARLAAEGAVGVRSEEHTSELQSH